MTKTTRLLPPFTYGGEMDTIAAAVRMAASHHAALVPLSLILRPQTRGKGVRLERKDFLEAVQQKAFRQLVSFERFEVFTGARVQRLFVLVDQLGCDGILLVLRGRNGSVLDAEMMEQRMAMRCWPLSHLSHRAGIRLGISAARTHLPLATGTSAVHRPAHATAASAQRAGGPGSGLDRAC
jgi:hypothetical protein